ncbi:hypothetical protein ACH47Z_18170 [Streptomyces sp. NPDC020192]|uniref:hypothetical protein n=1 Tax=Streptomyces sp. NPDC020192 TaxID=3365066 RepID=UPI0037A6C772
MDYAEIMPRVVGVLTRNMEINEQLRQDPSGVSISVDGLADQFVQDMVPLRFEVPAGASPQEVAEAIAAEMFPAIAKMVSAFSFAFTQLAEYHDAAGPERTAADVLREIALRANSFDAD